MIWLIHTAADPPCSNVIHTMSSDPPVSRAAGDNALDAEEFELARTRMVANNRQGTLDLWPKTPSNTYVVYCSLKCDYWYFVLLRVSPCTLVYHPSVHKLPAAWRFVFCYDMRVVVYSVTRNTTTRNVRMYYDP